LEIKAIDLPTLSRLSYIFLFVFMSAMLFTVFASLPLLEEETSSKKLEIPKKASGGGSDSDDDESGSDNISFSGQALTIEWLLAGNNYLHVQRFHHYFCLMEDVTTPPPRF